MHRDDQGCGVGGSLKTSSGCIYCPRGRFFLFIALADVFFLFIALADVFKEPPTPHPCDFSTDNLF